VFVLTFHFAPDLLPAGFVGVDIFFVLSGFLITGLLLTASGGRGSGLGTFLARRARRLLPTAGLVLLTTLGASLLLLPRTRWEQIATEAVASALQFENWWLARSGAEYSAAEVASPLQHFWSLSVEWQIYLIWLLLFALAAVALRSRVRVALLGAVTLTLVSLGFALLSGALDADLRYFATPIRVWEFGVGAILAFLPAPHGARWGREAVAVGGLVAMIGGALLTDLDTHPGASALLPVAGAAAIIQIGRSGQTTVIGRALAAAPLRVIGDHSYAVYLWHWPVLLLLLAATDTTSPGVGEILAALLITALLSIATNRWLERPIRERMPLRRALVTAGLAVVLPTLAALPVVSATAALRAQLEVTAPGPGHPGALALDDGADVALPDVPFIPDVAVAAEDRGDPGPGLHCLTPRVTPVVCDFGDPTADRVIVIVGDSHAWQWVPVLDLVGRDRGWRVESLVRPSCPLAPTGVDIPGIGDDGDCALWRENALRLLEVERPDVVLTTGLTPSGYEVIDYQVADVATFAEGYIDVWSRLMNAGITVGAIRDTPYFPVDVPGCVAEHLRNPDVCDRSRAEVLDPTDDPLISAAERAGVPLIDLSDAICRATTCPVVIGNVLVYRDRHHLTATYARTLEAALIERLEGHGLLE
jgi:peptidoglycan/LPS O-acetylase OafA/YrhL